MRLLAFAARAAVPFVCLVAAGCAAVPAAPRPGPVGTVPAEGPLAAFARDAVPGQRAVVALGDGRSVPVTLQRAYAAGSGAECRVLRVEDVPGGRNELVCRDADRGWHSARPLLRGGAVAVR